MNRLLDLARFDATSADLHPFDLAVREFDPHALDIWIPPTPGPFVGMAYLVSRMRFATTDLTDLGHLLSLLKRGSGFYNGNFSL